MKRAGTLTAGVSLGIPNLTDTLTSLVSSVSSIAGALGWFVVLGGEK